MKPVTYPVAQALGDSGVNPPSSPQQQQKPHSFYETYNLA